MSYILKNIFTGMETLQSLSPGVTKGLYYWYNETAEADIKTQTLLSEGRVTLFISHDRNLYNMCPSVT